MNFDYKEEAIQKITLQYSLVHVKRPWLNEEILNNAFFTSGPKREMAYYAQQVLLIKKLRVILKENFSPEQKTELEPPV